MILQILEKCYKLSLNFIANFFLFFLFELEYVRYLVINTNQSSPNGWNHFGAFIWFYRSLAVDAFQKQFEVIQVELECRQSSLLPLDCVQRNTIFSYFQRKSFLEVPKHGEPPFRAEKIVLVEICQKRYNKHDFMLTLQDTSRYRYGTIF